MTSATAITPVILDTVLGHLASHFMTAAGDDLPTARHAASRMLACHDVETEEELLLAADVVNFGFHALEALSEAAAPDLPMNTRIRLRGNAVSLSRESHKARRKLDQLQRTRRAAVLQPEAQVREPPPTQQQPATIPTDAEPVGDRMEFARDALQASAPKVRIQTVSQTRQQRRAAERAAENIRRGNAERARREAKAAIRSAAA